LAGFPAWSTRYSKHRRPREFLRSQFILLGASVRLQSPGETGPPLIISDRGSSLEVSCLFALSAPRVRCHDGFHAVAAFRPQVFSTSRRFAPQVTFTGLFHPVSTSRLRPSGFSPLQEPSWLVAKYLALWWLASAVPSLARRSSRRPTSGPCSPGESVETGPQLSEPTTRSPLGLSPRQGLLHCGRRTRFHVPPLTSFASLTYGTRAWLPHRVFPSHRMGRLSRDGQPS